MKNSTPLLILAVIILGLFVIVNVSPRSKTDSIQPAVENPSPTQSDSPKILSTKPNPLEEAVLGANDTVEITFNRSLQNSAEFRVRIEPKIDFKIELSSDRKTAKIIPLKLYELGTTYTLFIGTDTKFDGVGAWGQEKIFHFKTIRYRGV